MIDYAEAEDIPYKNSSVKKAICIGEPVKNPDFSLNALGQRIKDRWDIDLYSTYASTEMATAFTECEAGQGGHLHPELIIAEILDDEGRQVANDQPGELTITTLGIEGLPLLRFRTGDICVMHTEVCTCGRSTPRLSPILGRKHQVIKYKGTTCYPPALFDVLDNIPSIIHYQIEVFSNEYNNDEVVVKYCATTALDPNDLINHFKTKARFTPKLQPMGEEEIMQLIYPTTSRKPVKFVDRRGSA
jgi:phenylacetate-CoA ligase